MRDILLRALKTWLQSFTAVLMASGSGFLRIEVVKAAAISGLAAVVSFVNNAVTSSEIHALKGIRDGRRSGPAS